MNLVLFCTKIVALMFGFLQRNCYISKAEKVCLGVSVESVSLNWFICVTFYARVMVGIDKVYKRVHTALFSLVCVWFTLWLVPYRAVVHIVKVTNCKQNAVKSLQNVTDTHTKNFQSVNNLIVFVTECQFWRHGILVNSFGL